MKHGSNSRRGRSRGSGKRHSSPRNQTFDSSGPEGKVRGTPQQILDKYLSLARDAASAGEHIAAEGFYQFAEHYYRILSADQQNRQRAAENQQAQQDNADESAAGSQKGDQKDDQRDDRKPDQSHEQQAAQQSDDQSESEDGGQDRKPKSRGNGRRRNGGDNSNRADAEAAGDSTPEAESDDDASSESETDEAKTAASA